MKIEPRKHSDRLKQWRKCFFICMLPILAFVASSSFSTAQDNWRVYEESTIDGAITGSIKKGYILKTVSKNIYEIAEYVYLYEYEYSPKVVVLTDGMLYKLMIDGISQPLVCRKLNDSEGDKSTGEPVIESYIASRFDGLQHGNVYRLGNGQIWEQVDAWIWVWVWVNPKVTIYKTGGLYKMKVEQIEHPVVVERLK